jgi:hypothetical protein
VRRREVLPAGAVRACVDCADVGSVYGVVCVIMRWLIVIGILVMVMLFAAFMLKMTYVDPMPNVVDCTPERITPMVEVTVETLRVRGTIVERHAFGCTLYYYEARGAGD